MRPPRAELVVLDGAGLAPPSLGNVVDRTWMPHLFSIFDRCGMIPLEASGDAVGLFEGQAGNSEVGHLTLGLGRRTVSALVKIDRAFRSGDWSNSAVWKLLRANGSRIHILGLVSDAGVHGHWRTIVQAANLARSKGFQDIVIHPVLDGVDSTRGSAPALLEQLVEALAGDGPSAKFGVVIGRHWFADRSGDCGLTGRLVTALRADQPLPRFTLDGLRLYCERKPEHLFPAHLVANGVGIRPGENVVVTSHRADRAVQTVRMLAESCMVATMVTISDVVPYGRTFFPTEELSGGLAEVLKRQGQTLTRIAERCKFPHVTYFFNGFRESLGERQICIPDTEGGPDRCPEMRAMETAESCCDVMKRSDETAFVVNIPNLDQVGHFGDVELCQRAAVAVDRALVDIVEAAQRNGWTLAITADHGNAEMLIDGHGRPFGSHTTNTVPFTVVGPERSGIDYVPSHGSLQNVASTLALLLGLNADEVGPARPLIREFGRLA